MLKPHNKIETERKAFPVGLGERIVENRKASNLAEP